MAGLPSAQAQEEAPLFAVLRPKQRGLSVRDVALLEQAVQGALRDSGRLTTSARERDLLLDQEGLTGCYRESCLDRLGRLLRVGRVLAYRVYAEPSPIAVDRKTEALGSAAEPPPPGEHFRQFAIRVSLHNIEAGARGGQAQVGCAACSIHQAALLLTAAVTSVAEQDSTRPRGRLEIDSAPAGATVILDGIETEPTPYKRPLFVGPHQITLRRPGFRAYSAQIDLAPTQVIKLTPRLQPGSDGNQTLILRERQPRPTWRLALGGTLTALGLGGLALGATGIILDGRCVSPPMPPAEECDAVYQSQASALAYGLSGAALTTFGLLLLALPGPRTPPPPPISIRDTFDDLQ